MKMPVARQAILDVHRMAGGLLSPVDTALCRGVGQACSAVHTEAHGIGLPIYELTAIVRESGEDGCRDAVENKTMYYIQMLDKWKNIVDAGNGEWAEFLLNDNRPNKERIIAERKSGSRDRQSRI